jgi:hypothetical protein
MQGFWVRAENDGGELTVNNNARAHSNQQWLKDNQMIPGILHLAVSSNANAYRDEIIVEFGHKSDRGGAQKMSGIYPTAPGLYSKKHNEKWSISFLTNISEHASIPLGFKAGVETIYTLSVPGSPFDEELLIEDLFTATMHSLTENPEYHFSAKPGDPEDRFILHFKALGTEAPPVQSPEIHYASGMLTVINTFDEAASVQVYDMNGRCLAVFTAARGLNRFSLKPHERRLCDQHDFIQVCR